MEKKFVLPGGINIGCPGFGTWRITGEAAATSVELALRAGYRHIDTAAAYENEEFVGHGIKRSGVAREDIFITTKLCNRVRTYDDAVEELEGSLGQLGTDHVDLCLIHWPNPLKFRSCWKERNAELWRALEDMQKKGMVVSIGVSNFCPRHIEALLESAEAIPAVNQIRLCPGDYDKETVDYCISRGIMLEAYSPLGSGKAAESERIAEIAAKYGGSSAQICLNWCIAHGFLPIVKAERSEHIRANLEIGDIELSGEDIAALDGMTGECGLHVNPDEKPF